MNFVVFLLSMSGVCSCGVYAHIWMWGKGLCGGGWRRAPGRCFGSIIFISSPSDRVSQNLTSPVFLFFFLVCLCSKPSDAPESFSSTHVTVVCGHTWIFTWIQRFKLRFCARGSGNLSHESISSAPGFMFYFRNLLS